MVVVVVVAGALAALLDLLAMAGPSLSSLKLMSGEEDEREGVPPEVRDKPLSWRLLAFCALGAGRPVCSHVGGRVSGGRL